MGGQSGAAETPFVSGAQVPLKFRCKGQFIALYNIIGRRQDLGDFCIKDRNRA